MARDSVAKTLEAVRAILCQLRDDTESSTTRGAFELALAKLSAIQDAADANQQRLELQRFLRYVDDCLPWTDELLKQVQQLKQAIGLSFDNEPNE